MDKKDGMDLTVSYVSEFKFENGNVSLRDMYAASLQRISELEAENAKLHDELHAIKYEIMGGEDVPGSASAATLDDIKKEIERKLEAALPQWQPIETAPKGGGAELVSDPRWVDPPRVLLYCDDGTQVVAYWDWYYAEGGRGCVDGVAWVSVIGSELVSSHSSPTHWQPLPQPPGE